MHLSKGVFLKNCKDAKKATTGVLSDFGKDFLNKHFASNIGKIKYLIMFLGKKVYREKKVGESGPLPQNVKDKYKSNFESIVLNILNTKNASISRIEPVVEIELKKPTVDINKTSSLTSEESSDDYFEKARIFSINVLNKGEDINLNFKGEPIILKKNSFFAFGDNFEEIDESDIDETEALESDLKDTDAVDGLEQDKI
jgi:hypothetical protein